MVDKEIERILTAYVTSNYSEEWDTEGLLRALRIILPMTISPEELQSTPRQNLATVLNNAAAQLYDEVERRFGEINIPDGDVFGVTFGQELLGAAQKKPGPLVPADREDTAAGRHRPPLG